MARATWNEIVLAEGDDYEIVEGNVYFSPQSVHTEYLQPGDRQYTCPWKGETAYHDIVVGDEINRNAAWSYPEPKEAAANIKGHFAFAGSGIKVER